MVAKAGCASKLGQAQLTEVLRQIPRSANPNLLVGFETGDDAGIFLLSEHEALVQTVDFFTPIVDDPYAYGQIAAANALSDIYAMGGRPLTVLNIACFAPQNAPPEVWAAILQGAYDKTTEAGAVVMGGHSIEDNEPKFGMAVTGLLDPAKAFKNTEAKHGDYIYLSKPLGTGILTTAHKFDHATDEDLAPAIESMSRLNRDACQIGLDHGVRCATDITGFGLAGHLWNVARASTVCIWIDSQSLPIFDKVEQFIKEGMITGGGARNRAFIGSSLTFYRRVEPWLQDLITDPQTSGGLALFSSKEIPGLTKIGQVTADRPEIIVK